MLVAVYSIAKNEEANVEGWAACSADADFRLILDTGSTDQTRRLAEQAGISVHRGWITPWRFDTARNVALSLVPPHVDYCIALDLDERLEPGWREALKEAHELGVDRPRYTYVWSPAITFGGDKIHRRFGYTWIHRTHETLSHSSGVETRLDIGMTITHHPLVKERPVDIDMLIADAREDPSDSRSAFYLGRELYFRKEWAPAWEELERYLNLPTARWAPERAHARRLQAECWPARAQECLLMGVAEAPDFREPWASLAFHYYSEGDTEGALFAARRALAITPTLEYFCESWASTTNLEAFVAGLQAPGEGDPPAGD